MNYQPLNIPDVVLLTPKVFGDERGFFLETFRQSEFEEHCGNYTFVQDNHSKSAKGILRGLHYQLNQPQGKLVRVTRGEVFDVAVDMRKSSPTFGQWVGAELTAENKSQLWVPEGFAHGFLTLSDVAEVQYKARGFWNKNCERAIVWNDPEIGIAWPLERLEGTEVSLSGKDAEAAGFKTAVAAEDVFA